MIRPDWMKPAGPDWLSRSERVIYDNPWIRVTEHEATAPTGHPALYGRVGYKNLAIGILPIHDDGTVTLVGQHRFPLMNYSWEIPEGGGPLGHDPLESAKRELREEAGLIAADWREALRFELSNSVSDERGFGYIATGLSPVETDPDETEVIAIARAPFREALDLALRGEIVDMITVAMLLRAHHMAVEGELPADLSRRMLARR